MTGLEVSGLTVRVAGKALVSNAGFDAPAGTITAVLGPNGAGKSTLLRALVSGIPSEEGRVTWTGEDLLAIPRRTRARRVALLEQDATTELPLTGRAVVGLGRIPHDTLLGGRDPASEAAIATALEDAGVEHLAERLLPTLSGGERQRVLIARALAQQPQLLLLDEPMNHLDIAAQLEILALLARLVDRQGLTVVAAIHDLAVAAAHAQRVVVMSRGAVVATGSTADTLTPELISDVFHVRAMWTTNPITGGPLLAVG